MALTLNQQILEYRPRGSSKLFVYKVTFDNSYATGGVSLTAANVGLSVIDYCHVSNTAGYVFEYDYTNSKVIAYRQKDPAAAGGADIPLPQVANAVDLSAVVTRAFIVGR